MSPLIPRPFSRWNLRLIKRALCTCQTVSEFRYNCLRVVCGEYSSFCRRGAFRAYCTAVNSEVEALPELSLLDPAEDKRILHNCLLHEISSVGWKSRRKKRRMLTQEPVTSAFVGQVDGGQRFFDDNGPTSAQADLEARQNIPTTFPYASAVTTVEYCDNDGAKSDNSSDNYDCDGHVMADIIQQRLRRLRQRAIAEDFCGSGEDGYVERRELWALQYGTVDTSVPASRVVCGGCGAPLHCHDHSWPGFLPAEVMRDARTLDSRHDNSDASLNQLICQRCYFLRHYNTALHVQVARNDYRQLMQRLNTAASDCGDCDADGAVAQRLQNRRRSLVLLMVDLLDFPGSIWPAVIDVIGRVNPLLVVGNKVDLLPADGPDFLSRVQACLAAQLVAHGLDTVNTKRIHLISARSGFGVEDMISRIMHNWRDNGDIYLVGSTNVGKSTLFNTLLQSDLCRSSERDLIRRATTSQWPGTTLNMLKFPLIRSAGSQLQRRAERLDNERALRATERRLLNQQLRSTGNPKLAMLTGHIGRTFGAESLYNDEAIRLETTELQSPGALGGLSVEDDRVGARNWLFDTPGCVSDNQIIDLLTQEELLLALPRDLLRPRTFSLYPRQTLFIGGLARLDYELGPSMIRLTVFASKHLPVTVVATSDASDIYSQYLNSQLLVAPCGDAERMSRWPGLQDTQVHVDYSAVDARLLRKNKTESCADIVLSSAGWVSVTPCPEWGGDNDTASAANCEKSLMTFTAHTPRAAGVCVRQPALLPRAVLQRGRRLRPGPSHAPSALYIPPPSF